MIRVTVKKLKVRKKNDFAEGITVDIANLFAEGVAGKIKKVVKNIKCDNHNPARMTIIVSANIKKMVSVKKAGYCCKEFSDKVQIENIK